MSYENVPTWKREIPEHFKTQEMCNKAFDIEPFSLPYVPDHFKTQELCERAVEEGLYMLMFVPDHFKTKRICERAVKAYPWLLCSLPDSLVVLQEMWCVDFGYIDYLIGWQNAYQRRRVQKASIKEELLPIAWHSCQKMKKKETEKLWA